MSVLLASANMLLAELSGREVCLTLGMLRAECHHAAFSCYVAWSIPARHLQRNTVNEEAMLQVEKPREDYIMVIDADSILRKPFLPEELHLELGAPSDCA